MSKRHRKTKNMFAAAGEAAPYTFDMAYAGQKGKKPKGRHRRESHKRAYYDD